jgi:ACS family pantothenate transporter-like MFS transporter
VQLGRGFPATFGFVIAAIIVVIGIQLLAVRERRLGLAGSGGPALCNTGSEEVEDQEYGVDSKKPRIETKRTEVNIEDK